MIRKIEEIDIAGLNKLPPVEWNHDYESFLRDYLNEDYFFAFNQFQDNQIVGTGNVFLKGKIGWLANIIVDENHRGKGLGFEMTQYLVDFLKDKGCETQLLIATELGEVVYKKIGFEKLTEYQSYVSIKDREVSNNSSIRILKPSDLKNVYKLDQEANGEDRTHLIDKCKTNGVGYFNSENELAGFYLPEFAQGLVLARTKQVGKELLELKHSITGKRTMLPIENQKGVALLERMNLKKGVTSSKMILGQEKKWNPTYIYSFGSGYCG